MGHYAGEMGADQDEKTYPFLSEEEGAFATALGDLLITYQYGGGYGADFLRKS